MTTFWRILAAVGLLVLAFPLSAPIRYLTGLSLDASLLVAAAICLLATLVIYPGLRVEPSRPSRPLLGALLFIALFAFSMWRLYLPQYGGLPALSGGDAGNHVLGDKQFVSTQPGVYLGMVTLQACREWLARGLGLDHLAAYGVLLYGTLAALWLGAAVSVVSLLRRDDETPATALVRAVTALAALILLADRVVLPLFHVYQADGFWPQLWGLTPTWIGLLVYAAGRRRWLRLLTLVAWLVMVRFSYLLNLGDLCLVVGVLLLDEARGVTARVPRAALRIGAVVAAAAAVVCYWSLVGIARTPGGFFLADFRLQLAGLAVAALLLLWLAAQQAGGSAAHRLFLAAGWYGLGAVSAASLFHLVTSKTPYYFLKYGLSPIMVCSVTAAVGTAERLLRWRSLPRGAALAQAALLAVAIVLLAQGVAAYRPSYLLRTDKGPVHPGLDVLLDRGTARSVESTLASESCAFGGLLTPSWTEASFSNAMLGRDELICEGERSASCLSAIYSGHVNLRLDSCFFFYQGTVAERSSGRWPEDAKGAIGELESLGAKHCAPHTIVSLGVADELCHVRLSGVIQEVSIAGSGGGALQGFGELETLHNVSWRWTLGHGVLEWKDQLVRPQGRPCVLQLAVHAPFPFEARLDGKALSAMGHLYPLPAELAAGATHQIEVVSPTFVPADHEPGSTDRRTLGVQVFGARVFCPGED